MGSPATKEAFLAAGFPIKYFDTKFGYSRVATASPLQAAASDLPDDGSHANPSFDADSPFLLIARCHVKPDCLDDYLRAAAVADAAVKETEPGMLHHTFDQDPSDPLAFVWSEVYKDDASLLFHLTNPPLTKFVEQHGEMGDDFSIEVYGTLSPATKEAFSAAGFPIKYFDTKFGYSRVATASPLQAAASDLPDDGSHANPSFDADSPFLLIARCHVKPDCLDDYLRAAAVADAAVKETEPGMLHHTFDQDPSDPLAFVWSEAYKDDASLLF